MAEEGERWLMKVPAVCRSSLCSGNIRFLQSARHSAPQCWHGLGSTDLNHCLFFYKAAFCTPVVTHALKAAASDLTDVYTVVFQQQSSRLLLFSNIWNNLGVFVANKKPFNFATETVFHYTSFAVTACLIDAQLQRLLWLSCTEK